MSFSLSAVELADALPTVTLAPGADGTALLVRSRGRPVGFALVEPGGCTIAPDDLESIVSSAAGLKLVEDQLLEQLVARPAPTERSVTVAICTRDRTDLLSTCLATVPPPDEGRVEVLVVDNSPSDDSTQRLVEVLPGVRYVREPRPGLDFARNRALREASGEVLAFVDDDVRLDEGWLEGLRDALAENPDAGAVTGLVLPAELDTDAQVLFERRGGFRRGVHKRRFTGPTQARNPLFPAGAGVFGAGCNMAFDRSLLLELGGFDEALDTGPPLPGGGDLDIFYRVVRRGHPLVYEPSMTVFHRHRREREKLRHQYWTWGTGMMAFVRKSWRDDVANRVQLDRMVRWWMLNQLETLVQTLRGKGPLPVDMVAAELAGGIAGLGWKYPQSLRRSDAIRRSHA